MIGFSSYNEPDPDFNPRQLIGLAVGLLLGLLACVLLSSCKTKYVEVERQVLVPEYHNIYINNTDTLIEKDSIYILDSLYVATRCDTIYKEKYRTTYHDRIIYKAKTDTIKTADTLTVVKTDTIIRNIKLKSDPTFAQKAVYGFKGVLWFLLIAVIGYILYKFRTPIKSFFQTIIKLYFR